MNRVATHRPAHTRARSPSPVVSGRGGSTPSHDLRLDRFSVSPPTHGGELELPPAFLRRMESAFGQSFSDVQVREAPDLAGRHLAAVARGSSIDVAPGFFQPHDLGGQAVLAHELAHVVQQREERVPGAGLVSHHALEAEADQWAMRAVGGQSVGASTGSREGNASPAAGTSSSTGASTVSQPAGEGYALQLANRFRTRLFGGAGRRLLGTAAGRSPLRLTDRSLTAFRDSTPAPARLPLSVFGRRLLSTSAPHVASAQPVASDAVSRSRVNAPIAGLYDAATRATGEIAPGFRLMDGRVEEVPDDPERSIESQLSYPGGGPHAYFERRWNPRSRLITANMGFLNGAPSRIAGVPRSLEFGGPGVGIPTQTFMTLHQLGLLGMPYGGATSLLMHDVQNIHSLVSLTRAWNGASNAGSAVARTSRSPDTGSTAREAVEIARRQMRLNQAAGSTKSAGYMRTALLQAGLQMGAGRVAPMEGTTGFGRLRLGDLIAFQRQNRALTDPQARETEQQYRDMLDQHVLFGLNLHFNLWPHGR